MHILNFIIFFLFSVFLSQENYAAEKNELYLVVGNCRREGAINIWWKHIVGNQTDFTHKNTYNGKATTLDIESSAISGVPHIQADAKTYNPGSQCIRSIFMELFPSIDIRQIGVTKGAGNNPEKELEKMKLLPNVIRNFSLYMFPGSLLEIEHVPHFTLFDSNFYVRCVSYLKEENPFHLFISPLFMENLKSKKIIDPSHKLEYWEQVKAQKLSQKWTEENTNTVIAEAAESHPLLLQALINIQQFIGFNEVQFHKRIDTEIEDYEKDAGKFHASFHNTLSSVVAQEFCLLSQHDLIKNFLEQSGFEKVHIAHQDNKYNGRKKVWMITAIKR